MKKLKNSVHLIYVIISNIKKLTMLSFIGILAVLNVSCNLGTNNNVNANNIRGATAKISSTSDKLPIHKIVTVFASHDLLLAGGDNEIFQGVIYNSNNIVNWYQSSISHSSFPKAIYSIAKNSNNKFIAVGLYSEIDVSDDGISWKPQNTSKIICDNRECNLLGITAYQDRFVAVGDFGTIITSTDDGQTWTKVNSHTDEALNAITVDKNGRFIAVGLHGVVITSDDGIDWQSGSTNYDYSLRSVAVNNNGTIVIVGDHSTFVSTDGKIWWKTKELPNNILYSVATVDNKFVAVGSGGIVLVSENGQDWNRYISGIGVDLYGVTYSKDHKLFIAVGNSAVVSVSKDGQIWNQISELKQITQFGFKEFHTSTLINDDTITVRVPYETDITESLTAIFTYNGASVKVNGVKQFSGETKHYFSESQPLVYTVEAANHTSKNYLVKLQRDTVFGYAYITNSSSYVETDKNKVIRCVINSEIGDLSDCTDSKAPGLNTPEGIVRYNDYIFIVDPIINKLMRCQVDVDTGYLINCGDSGVTLLNSPMGVDIYKDDIFIINSNIIGSNNSMENYVTKCHISENAKLADCSKINIHSIFFWLTAEIYNGIAIDPNSGTITLFGITMEQGFDDFYSYTCIVWLEQCLGLGIEVDYNFTEGLAFRKVNNALNNAYFLYATSTHDKSLKNNNDTVLKCRGSLTDRDLHCDNIGKDITLLKDSNPKGITFININDNTYVYIIMSGKKGFMRCKVNDEGNFYECLATSESDIFMNPRYLALWSKSGN